MNEQNESDSPGSVQRMVRRHLFDDWKPIQATMFWYRFGKLTNRKNRLHDQIPLGFGWIFNTDKWYLNDIRLPPEQNRNHSYPTARIRKRIEFWKRWLDPVILVPASLFCRVLEAGLRVFSTTAPGLQNEGVRPPETLERSDRLLEVRSPVTGLTEWYNLGAIQRLFYREGDPMGISDAEQSVSGSYVDDVLMPSNDPSSPTAGVSEPTKPNKSE